MDNAMVSTAKLIALGDAIRAKTGLSDSMTLDEMATAVSNIETGSSDITVSPTVFVADGTALYADYEGVFHSDDTTLGATFNPCYVGALVIVVGGTSTMPQVTHLTQVWTRSARDLYVRVYQVTESPTAD